MRRLIMRLRIRLFGEPDVGNAVKSLNKAVAKVQAAAAYQADKAVAMAAAAKAAERAAEDATKRALRADRVGKNLSNILCLDEED